MTPVPGSKAAQVYAELRERILSGTYSPGYRLVLSTLASELGVSVVPVREAVRRLEAEGLVEYTHNVGAQVRAVDLHEYAEAMATLALLEGMATALAAPHVSAAALQEAEALNEQMRDLTVSSFSSDAYRSLNGHFHTLLTDPCPNRHLLSLVRSEAERVNMIRRSHLRFSPSSSGQSVRQHAQLLALIRSQAPAQDIERYAREHKLASMNSHLAQG